MDCYIWRDGTISGPYTREWITAAARSGVLFPTDYLWSDRYPYWVPASSQKGLWAPPANSPPKKARKHRKLGRTLLNFAVAVVVAGLAKAFFGGGTHRDLAPRETLKLPLKLDETTTLVSVNRSGLTVRYHHHLKLTAADFSPDDRATTRATIAARVCGSQPMRSYMEAGYTYIYTFDDRFGQPLAEFTFRKGECPSPIPNDLVYPTE